MVKGIYTAASGMMTQYKKMDVVSNNIANMNTTGYKKDGVISKSFGEVMMMRVNAPGEAMPQEMGKMTMGVTVSQIYTDSTQGALVRTDSPYDVAIEGTGYLMVGVKDAEGNITEHYTRNGRMNITADGYLVTSEGHAILGNEGPIKLPEGKELTIKQDGTLLMDGAEIDKIQFTDFEDVSTLRKIGNSLYASTEESVKKDFSSNVQQGFVEGSNVEAVKEMVDMINLSRAYETSQKLLTANDEALGKAVNDVGRL